MKYLTILALSTFLLHPQAGFAADTEATTSAGAPRPAPKATTPERKAELEAEKAKLNAQLELLVEEYNARKPTDWNVEYRQHNWTEQQKIQDRLDSIYTELGTKKQTLFPY